GNHKRNLRQTRHCGEIQRPRIAQATDPTNVEEYPWEIGSPINLSEQIFLTALSVPISMLSGGSLNDEEAKLGLEIKDRLEEFVRLMGEQNLSDIFSMLRPFHLQGIESKSKSICHGFMGFSNS
ncbi:hypothetical protein Goari_011631, partial [Gossypium aridum]|nr:hypothetical protein [Gossypium aridum]